MKRKLLSLAVIAALTFCAITGATFAQTGTTNKEFTDRVRNHRAPHLTVVISIDQFRADYLRRYADLFLPAKQGGKVGGFRYLMEQGAYYIDAKYDHAPTFTGPGHSIILTGGYPYKTGIVGNDWWDKTSMASMYCVDDPRQKVVGAAEGSAAKPMGPLNLKSSTVGDELKLASAGASTVVTLSLKDRAAILLGGHAQNVSLWFDDAGGRWISSTAYCKDGKLPAWAESLNAQHVPEKTFGTTWTPSVPPEILKARTISPELTPEHEPYGMGRAFPHAIGMEKVKQNYRAFTLTPAANAFVFNTAKQAVSAEKLGQHGDTPDLLAMNLATNDYVGHAFGPYSPEALDITVQTDRQLSDFLNFLQTTVPGGLKEVVFVVTADHGVSPVPENLQARDISSDRVLDSRVNEAAQKALVAAFGEASWLAHRADGKAVGYVEPYMNLDDAAITQALTSGKAASRAQIEDVAAKAVASVPGIYACYTRTQITEGKLPQTEITRRIVHGFHPKVSGDIFVVSDPLYFTDPGTPGPYVTTHGSPFSYDTHVPILIAGPGIQGGVYTNPVSPADIAPTLCALLGIEYPSACDGVILPNVFQ